MARDRGAKPRTEGVGWLSFVRACGQRIGVNPYFDNLGQLELVDISRPGLNEFRRSVNRQS